MICGGAYGLHHRTGSGGEVEHLPPPGTKILHRGADSGCAEIWLHLGYSRRRGQAGGPAPEEKGAGSAVTGPGCTGHTVHHDAPDEHAVPAGTMQEDRGGHDGRAPKGHGLGGILLFQRTGGAGCPGSEPLSHQPGPGAAVVRLLDLWLRQSHHRPDPAGTPCPGDCTAHPGGRGGTAPPICGRRCPL